MKFRAEGRLKTTDPTLSALTDDGRLRSAVADPNHIISVFSGLSCNRLAPHQAATSAMHAMLKTRSDRVRLRRYCCYVRLGVVREAMMI